MPAILFISHSKRGPFYYNDASARYRCVFPAEFLQEIGIRSHVIHFSQIGSIDINEYSHIIFHRPQFSLKLQWVLHKARLLNIKTTADFDDLLFRPELAYESAAVQSGYMSIKLAKKQASAYLKALKLFNHAWVSTEPLKQQIAIACPHLKITVCHNKLPERWAKLSSLISWQQRLKDKTIRYMPGTSHHKHDFEKIENLLIQLLKNNPEIKLEVVGQLNFNINKFPPKQISQQANMTFEALPRVIGSSWLTIAPLQDNIFNQCKSGLKFWESGLYGVPVISSPLPDIARFKNKGLLLSDNSQDWSCFIESMLDPDNYQNASNAAFKHAKQAVFNESDERLGVLGIHEYKNEAEDKNTKITPNFSDIQLIMTANYGPRWPGKWLNPTETAFEAIQEKLNQLLSNSGDLKNEERQSLKIKAEEQTKWDIPPKKHKVIRKVKKLRNSPYDFFRDIAKK